MYLRRDTINLSAFFILLQVLISQQVKISSKQLNSVLNLQEESISAPTKNKLDKAAIERNYKDQSTKQKDYSISYKGKSSQKGNPSCTTTNARLNFPIENNKSDKHQSVPPSQKNVTLSPNASLEFQKRKAYLFSLSKVAGKNYILVLWASDQILEYSQSTLENGSVEFDGQGYQIKGFWIHLKNGQLKKLLKKIKIVKDEYSPIERVESASLAIKNILTKGGVLPSRKFDATFRKYRFSEENYLHIKHDGWRLFIKLRNLYFGTKMVEIYLRISTGGVREEGKIQSVAGEDNLVFEADAWYTKKIAYNVYAGMSSLRDLAIVDLDEGILEEMHNKSMEVIPLDETENSAIDLGSYLNSI